MLKVDISVVIVHWNVPGLLDQCLASLEADCRLANVAIETIIVDNNSSTPGADEVASRYCDTRLINLDDNLGYAAANNVGIAASGGDLVLILNPDTVLQEGAMAELHATLHLSPHIGLVAPLLLNPDLTLQSSGYRFPGLANVLLDQFPVHPRLVGSSLNGRIHPGDGALPYAIGYPLGAAMMLRRSALEDVGGFDESYFMYSEEVDLAQRLAHAGWTRMLAPRAKVIHLGGQSTGQQPAAMYVALWLSRACYHRRWTPRGRRMAISAAVALGTRWQDRNADPERQDANRKIRRAFAEAIR